MSEGDVDAVDTWCPCQRVGDGYRRGEERDADGVSALIPCQKTQWGAGSGEGGAGTVMCERTRR